MQEPYYICIDLKSFYASVECVDRGLDPMSARLVVADPEREEGTICLAVSPALKKLGVKNRCRVFEIPKSIDYIMAEPRMQRYIDCAVEIYGIYLDHISADDIHVYSIDEVFIEATPYLHIYDMSARSFALMLMEKVRERLGIRAAAGIGSNLYLTKVALDIMAKRSPDFIGFLDEELYRKKLWRHRPLTDFWRIGSATQKTLERMGILDMRQLAFADEDMLYRKFGIDAELLIDHAYGRETTTMRDIKRYRPKNKSLTSGQVLMRDYTREEASIVLKEMAEQLCLDMCEEGLYTESATLYVGYSHKYGVGSTKGTAVFLEPTHLPSLIVPEIINVFMRITYQDVPVRRLNISCNNVRSSGRQLSVFETGDARDESIQPAVCSIKKRFGGNAVLRGSDLLECATAPERNMQIGGHKSGGKSKDVKRTKG